MRALWPLIVARGALLTASSEQQRKVDPDNAYVAGNAEHEWAIFSVATSVSMELMEAAIFYALGIEHSQPALGAIGHLLLDIDVEKISGLDLSVTSTEFAANNWSLPDIETQLLKTAARATGAAATRYGEFRLTRTQVNNTEVPESFALYVDLCLPAKTRYFAPFNGFVEHRDGHITLVGDVLQLHLDGLDCCMSRTQWSCKVRYWALLLIARTVLELYVYNYAACVVMCRHSLPSHTIASGSCEQSSPSRCNCKTSPTSVI